MCLESKYTRCFREPNAQFINRRAISSSLFTVMEQNNQNGQSFGEGKKWDATCSDCGAQTQVPFEPDGDRPVRCIDCYRKWKANKPKRGF